MSVSRVLRDPQSVSESLRLRVEAAISQLSYVPNRAAQMLSATSQIKIGLLYNHPRSAYAVDLLIGAVDQATLSDVQILVRGCTLDDDDLGTLARLLDQSVDAVILTAPLCESDALIAKLGEAGVAAVLVGTSMQPIFGTAMHIDEFAAAYEMTRHIAAGGHVRIGFIKGAQALSASAERLAGYRAALEDMGFQYDEGLVAQGLFTYRSGLDAAERLLAAEDRPSAIFASNDDMAAATVATVHRMGLHVPDDVAVFGFDDSWIATNIWPELTTVRQPVVEMGSQAVRNARELASNGTTIGSPPLRLVFPHELVLRGSGNRV